ncbi:MAG: hypothetical protein ACYC43_10225 [Burkholderiales bacterium]
MEKPVPVDSENVFMRNVSRICPDLIFSSFAEAKAMKKYQQWNLKWIFVFIIQFALISCATGGTMFVQDFSFDTINDSPDVDVLDYRYGSTTQFGTHADPERVALGEVFGQRQISGAMPRGDFLYVKWRIKQSGKIYEDKVDLRNRLPADMTNYGIHFVIKGSQLYVFLFPPFKVDHGPGWGTVITPGLWAIPKVGESFLDVPYNRKHQIYPDSNQAK